MADPKKSVAPSKPAADPKKPAADARKPAADAKKSGADPKKPATAAKKSAADPKDEGDDPKPAADAKPAVDAKPAADPKKPTGDPKKAVARPAGPMTLMDRIKAFFAMLLSFFKGGGGGEAGEGGRRLRKKDSMGKLLKGRDDFGVTDPEEQDRKRKQQQMLGNSGASADFVARKGVQMGSALGHISNEYRSQVTAGMANGRSHTANGTQNAPQASKTTNNIQATDQMPGQGSQLPKKGRPTARDIAAAQAAKSKN